MEKKGKREERTMGEDRKTGRKAGGGSGKRRMKLGWQVERRR